ncbi:MAG TPA: hypothetical protein VGN57_13930 [Pirellulaceae bacterium]|jgi:hypothetical protein|nr:hypothetical protein [Pirellulaceae bacterium]
MPIRFACPHCEKTLKVDDRFAGRRAKCPNCRTSIEIPEQAVATASVGIAGVSIPSGQVRDAGQETPAVDTAPQPEPEVDRRRAAANGPDSEEQQASVPGNLSSESVAHAERFPADQASDTARRAAEASPSPEDERPAEPIAAESPPDPARKAPPPFEPPPLEATGAIAARRGPIAPPVDEKPRDDAEPFASPFEVFDDDAEMVYAEGYGGEEPERFLVSRTRLAIPRAFVYLQGLLLVAVAVISFVLGWAFGGSGAFRRIEAPSGPVTLSGTIRVDGYDGPIAASEGALVAILPRDRRPAEKIPVDGLRPSEIGRIVPPRTLGAIREMGGALAVSDSRGKFEAELPQPGEYHVLVVLPDVYRPTTSQIALADLARLGDYFLLPDQLIGDCRYELQTEQVDASETIVVRIP